MYSIPNDSIGPDPAEMKLRLQTIFHQFESEFLKYINNNFNEFTEADVAK